MVFYCVYTVCVAASMGFTGFYRVLLAFTELNCLFFCPGLLRFHSVASGFYPVAPVGTQSDRFGSVWIGLGSGLDRVFPAFLLQVGPFEKKAKRQNGIQQVVYHLHGKYLGPSHPPPP